MPHVPYHEVAPPDFGDEVLADGLVLFGGRLQRVGDDETGKEAEGEIDLHPDGGTAVVAVRGKLTAGAGCGFREVFSRRIPPALATIPFPPSY